MGNGKSKGQQNVNPPGQPRPQDPRRNLNDTKKVLFVHHSCTEEQNLVVENFEHVLTQMANGGVEVRITVNMANSNERVNVEDSTWLDEANKVILLSLKSETIPLLEQMIREKNYVRDDRLNGKVFSVTFGTSLNAQWPPQGIQHGTPHTRDFAFNFENMDSIEPQDFERSDTMRELVAAIIST